MHEVNKKSVYVGISGGVDSSVSAYLLKEAGYEVTGVFIRVWYPDFLECSWQDERRDAMRVCAELGIPFKELDLEETYKRKVADYMISEYKAGRTPNPDVMCNKYVKFGGFLDWAISEGADFVATGHYARILSGDKILEARNTKHEILNKSKLPKFQLLKGLDDNKDQTYFLWTLTSEQLSKVLFPIGHLQKSEVRALAKKAGLLTAEKKDSQGICFLGEVSMKDFLRKYVSTEVGEVLNENGEVIGWHEGALLYTIGERRGFTITKKTPEDKPYFVIAKDIDANTITVSDKREGISPLFNARRILLENMVWSTPPIEGGVYTGRIRYRQELQECTFESSSLVTFNTPQKAVALGQSVVLYDGEVCMGGGIMKELIV